LREYFTGELGAVQGAAPFRDLMHVKWLKNSDSLLAGYSVTLDGSRNLDEILRFDRK
jgi:hypothetical protein